MKTNSEWRAFTGVGSATFFAGLIVWTTLYGNPTNGLHTTAQTWAFMGLFGVIASIAGFELVKGKTP